MSLTDNNLIAELKNIQERTRNTVRDYHDGDDSHRDHARHLVDLQITVRESIGDLSGLSCDSTGQEVQKAIERCFAALDAIGVLHRTIAWCEEPHSNEAVIHAAAMCRDVHEKQGQCESLWTENDTRQGTILGLRSIMRRWVTAERFANDFPWEALMMEMPDMRSRYNVVCEKSRARDARPQ